MNNSKHQNKVQYPWTSICLGQGLVESYVGLTEVIQLSPHKLLFTKFLSLMIYLVVRIHALSQSLVQCTFAIKQLLGVLPLNSPSLTAPIMTRKSSYNTFTRALQQNVSAVSAGADCTNTMKLYFEDQWVQARQFQVANNYARLLITRMITEFPTQ